MINSNPPLGHPEAMTTDTGHCSTNVVYTPDDRLTPSQIGNRVAEIVKKMAAIERED